MAERSGCWAVCQPQPLPAQREHQDHCAPQGGPPPYGAPAECPGLPGDRHVSRGTAGTSPVEDIGSEEEVSHSTVRSLLATPPLLPPCRQLTFPQDPEGSGLAPLREWVGHSCCLVAPGPQLVWGKMGGSLREAIQTLSFGGKKAKEKHVFIT